MASSRVLLRIPLGGDAPTEVRLFKFGANETTQGTFIFDEISAASVMAADSDYGNERSADYEHQALFSPPVEAPASAWYRLMLRDDGLYAVEIRWTERARRMIEAGEYRYISPAFMVDPDTSRIMEYINFALTNLPATKRMEALLKADPLANFVADNYQTLVANGLVRDVSDKQRHAVSALKAASRLYVEAFSDDDDTSADVTVREDDDSGTQSDTTTEPQDDKASPVSDSIDTVMHGLSTFEGADSSRETTDPTNAEADEIMTDAVNVILETLGLSDNATSEEIRSAFEALVVKKPSPAPTPPAQDVLEPARIALGIKDGDAKAVSTAITTLRVQVEELNGELEDARAELTKRNAELDELRTQAEEQTVTMLLGEAQEANKLKDEAHGKAIVKALTNADGRVNVDALANLIESLPEVVNIPAAPVQEAPRNVEVKSSRWADREWSDLKPTEKIQLFEQDPDEYERKKAAYYSGR